MQAYLIHWWPPCGRRLPYQWAAEYCEVVHLTPNLCFTDSESDGNTGTRKQARRGSDGTTAA